MPGPPPKPNGERRRRNAPRANTTLLPAGGRPGPAPKWPLGGLPAEGWDDIWSRPQAVMWEKMGADEIVARYLLLREKIADPAYPESQNASFWNVLTNLEDRLGLTPTAMMRLQWEIEGTTVQPDEGQGGEGTVTRIDEVRRRLKDTS